MLVMVHAGTVKLVDVRCGAAVLGFTVSAEPEGNRRTVYTAHYQLRLIIIAWRGVGAAKSHTTSVCVMHRSLLTTHEMT
jgi:hypothetical protein